MQIVPNFHDEGTTIFNENVKIGYVENDTLYAIDKDGYAEWLCKITDKSEIEPRLTAWLNSHNPASISNRTTRTQRS